MSVGTKFCRFRCAGYRTHQFFQWTLHRAIRQLVRTDVHFFADGPHAYSIYIDCRRYVLKTHVIIRKLSYAASVGRVEIRQLWKYTVWSRQTNSPTSNVIRFRNEKEHTRHNQLSSHVDLRITFLHLPDLNALNFFTFQNRSDKRDSKYTSREFPYSYLAMVGACPRTHRERSHVQSEI